MRETVRVPVPVLPRLILGELAERRGQDEGALLSELILEAAVRELGSDLGRSTRTSPSRSGARSDGD